MRNYKRNDWACGFSLIEMIGVLAVLAILAAVLAPVLIRRMDRIAGEQERASLESFDTALKQSIRRTRYIPSNADWVATIAKQLDVNPSNVATNGRRQPRFLFIDPDFQIGTNGSGLPYNQSNWISTAGAFSGSRVVVNGLLRPPLNPRLLILSSIGDRISNAVITTSTDFNAVWNWNDASETPPAPYAYLNKGTDLKVQRVNLSSLFVRLLLTTYDSAGPGGTSIDWAGTNDVLAATGVDGYFIQNSILGLFKHSGELDSQQILTRDSSFVYNQNVWRGSIAGGFFLGGLDIGSVVEKFLAAPYNSRAEYTNRQQGIIVSNMMLYMDAYRAWASAGFPSGSLRNAATASQGDMVLSVRQLFEANSWHPNEGCP